MMELKTAPQISQAEQERRRYALNFARASVRLEGFVITPRAEAIHARYVRGEITDDERTQAILDLHKRK